jgi:hypothetical protein
VNKPLANLADSYIAVDEIATADRTVIVGSGPVGVQLAEQLCKLSPEQLRFIQDHGSSLLTEKFYADQMRITAETLLPLIK